MPHAQEARWTVLCHTRVNSLVVSMFEWSENIATVRTSAAVGLLLGGGGGGGGGGWGAINDRFKVRLPCTCTCPYGRIGKVLRFFFFNEEYMLFATSAIP